MSPAEFWQALDAHTHEKEADRMHTGELARGLGVRIFNLLVAKKGRIRNVQDFWRMPWDEDRAPDQEINRLTSLKGEDMKQEIELFYQRINGSKKTKSED